MCLRVYRVGPRAAGFLRVRLRSGFAPTQCASLGLSPRAARAQVASASSTCRSPPQYGAQSFGRAAASALGMVAATWPATADASLLASVRGDRRLVAIWAPSAHPSGLCMPAQMEPACAWICPSLAPSVYGSTGRTPAFAMPAAAPSAANDATDTNAFFNGFISFSCIQPTRTPSSAGSIGCGCTHKSWPVIRNCHACFRGIERST